MSKHRVAVVTGAASGIGRATAFRLTRDGFRVAGCDLAIEGMEQPDFDGTRINLARAVDVSNVQAIESFLNEVIIAEGKIDALVNCAGISRRGSLDLSEADNWRAMMDVNFFGTALTTVAALPHLIRTGGAVVNIGSELVVKPEKNLAFYSATKAAVVHLTKALAREAASQGVRINCVCPGPVDTPMIRRAIEGSAHPATTLKQIETSTLLSRLGSSEEIASAVAYLLSEEAAFITGSIFFVDGGASA